MVSDYLLDHHKDAKHLTRVRVGKLPAKAELLTREGISPKLYYPALHWADAIAVYPDRYYIIECKIKLTADALGQILTNAALVQQTEELKPLWELIQIKQVVYAYGDQPALDVLWSHDVQTYQYRPPYIEEYYMAKIRHTYRG